MREVVTEVAASTANIELSLWEAATVDGPEIGKMSMRTTEDENTVGWAASVPCCCCCWSAPVGFEVAADVALNGGTGRGSDAGKKGGGMEVNRDDSREGVVGQHCGVGIGWGRQRTVKRVRIDLPYWMGVPLSALSLLFPLACRSRPRLTTCWWFCPRSFASYSA